MPKALSEYEINVGKRVRNYRVTHDRTQDELAEYLKLPKQAISRIENGKRRISTEELEKIALFFDEPIQLFLNDDYKYIYPVSTPYGAFPVYMAEFLNYHRDGLGVNAGKNNISDRYTKNFINAIQTLNREVINYQKEQEKRWTQ